MTETKSPSNTPDLRRFYVKDRVVQLTDTEVGQLHTAAEAGDVPARFGYGRWLYFMNPYEGAIQDAERHFYDTREALADSLAAYSLMLRYGETVVTHPPVMDIEQSLELMERAMARGSEYAETLMARNRIYGNWCAEEPEAVADEITKRLESTPDSDPLWHILLAFAYEQMGRQNEAILQYEKAIARGEASAYGYLAFAYLDRGNTALYEEYMEEGIEKGCLLCYIYQTDMSDEDYNALPEPEKEQLHQTIEERLLQGLAKGEGFCAYYLWQYYQDGGLGFVKDHRKALRYLRRGVELACTVCMSEMSKVVSPHERDELRLQIARFLPHDEASLLTLERADDPAFLLRHKEELERYWWAAIAALQGEDDYEDDDGRFDAYV